MGRYKSQLILSAQIQAAGDHCYQLQCNYIEMSPGIEHARCCKKPEPSCLAQLDTAHLPLCHTETDTSGKLTNGHFTNVLFAILHTSLALTRNSSLPPLCLTVPYFGKQKASFLFSLCLGKLQINALKRLETNLHWNKYNHFVPEELRWFGHNSEVCHPRCVFKL